MSDADSKTGAYPDADQPNQFGRFYREFFDTWHATMKIDNAMPRLWGAYGIAKANEDPLFEKARGEFDSGPKDSTACVAVMHAAWALSVRLGWWTWRKDGTEEAILDGEPVELAPEQR